MYIEHKYSVAVWAVSGSVGLSIILSLFLLGVYSPAQPYLIPLSQKVNNAFALSLMITFGFPAVVAFNNNMWKKQVDQNIPRLLKDLTESVRSGMTLPRAVEDASQRDYGPVSKELERAISMLSLGANFEDTLMFLAKRLRRPVALRMCTILVEAQKTGGKLLEVLDTSVALFSSLNSFIEEEKNNMKPYMMTIYMATLTFLIISFIMLHQFLAPLAAASVNASSAQSGLLSGVYDINYYASLLFWGALLESIFGGLVVGKIVYRDLTAGLSHSLILMIITIIFFNIWTV
jgi:archaeal flagellar protein FlaJ